MSISPSALGLNSAQRDTDNERRHHQRTPFFLGRPVTLNLDHRDAGVVVDISEGGLGLHCLQLIQQGSTVELHFDLPKTNQPVEATAVVVWTSPSGRAGLRFLRLRDEPVLTEWLSHADEVEPSSALTFQSASDPEVAAIESAIASAGLNGNAVLNLLVDRAKGLTRAHGAAIAVAGDSGFVCRASIGTAPDLGVRLYPQSGLSGECVRTGLVVRCDDTESDSRVDRIACRSLDLRSAIVVPLIASVEQVIGLLEVFSSTAHAFSDADVLLLGQLAELTTRCLTRQFDKSEVRSLESAAPAELTEDLAAGAQSATDVATPRAQGTASQVRAAALPTPEAAPTKSQAVGFAAQTSPQTETVDEVVHARESYVGESGPTGIVMCDVCGHQNSVGARICQNCDVPLGAAIEAVTAELPGNFAMRQEVELAEPIYPRWAHHPRLRFTRRMRLFAGIAALLCALGVTSWHYWHRNPEARSANPSDTISEATEVRGDSLSSLAHQLGSAPPKPSAELVLAPSSGRRTSPAKPSASIPRVTSGEEVRNSITDKEQPVLDPVGAPELKFSASDAPVVSILPTPSSEPTFRPLSQGVTPAVLIHKTNPAYPPLATSSHIEGTVILQAIITRHGRLDAIRVEKGSPLLAQAAIRAVKEWRYKPSELDGQPVDVETRIIFNFNSK